MVPMISRIRYFSFLLLVGFVVNLSGQYSQPTRMPSSSTQAGVTQDIQLLKQQLGELQLEMERLTRENESLTLRLRRIEAQSGSDPVVVRSTLNKELSALRTEFNRLNKTQQEAILAKVSAQIKALAKETQKSINSVGSGSVGTGSTTEKVVTFSEDYPKSGVMYQVQGGDTLSKIAQNHGSSISFIKNANKIVDARKLQVGQTLFIPIKGAE